jgi:hypothetical protein
MCAIAIPEPSFFRCFFSHSAKHYSKLYKFPSSAS